MAIRQAVILVGGLGTRLGQRTRAIPKPLLPVAGRPFLSYLIDAAIARGLRDFIFLAGYHGDQISRMHEEYDVIGAAIQRANIRFRVAIESVPAGTAGALLQAREYLADEFLLLNGDSFFDFDWLDMDTIKTNFDWIGKIALRHVKDTGRYGLVDLDGDKIQSFLPRGEGMAGVINGGVYLLRHTILDYIYHTPMSLETEIFPALAEARRLYGRVYEGYFIDIGVPDDLERAEKGMARFR